MTWRSTAAAAALAGLFLVAPCAGGGVLAQAVQEARPPAPGYAPFEAAEEIVVTARQPGPAVWRLRKGAAEVILIGALQRDLTTQTWDLSRIDRLMDGAGALYVHRSGVRLGTSNPLDLFRAPGWLSRTHLQRGQTIDMVVGPALWARYLEVSSALGVTARLDETLKPFFFGAAFESAVFKKSGLQGDRATEAIVRLAEKRRIKVRPLDIYPLAKTVDDLLDITPEDGVGCFREAIEQTAFAAEYGAIASRAWAVGDLRTVRANTVSLNQNCLTHIPSLAKLVSTRVDEIAGLVETALAAPGKTVFVMPLEPLLQHRGVLERAKEGGADVTSPQL